ncbi:MAG: AAA family ATPase [Cetobacterium sp.]|uniref:nSTAND3 domain-containing NTPase n=1 Tax=Cetobacterium sp. TaxID=2071632 RepID=UPI003F3E23D3
MKYNYKRIESGEFELLSRDLISNYLKLDIRLFAKGKDGGIDGLYEQKNDKKIIFQAKHYIDSGSATLIRQLQNEVEKIRRKDPNRYILITTCNLSVGNIEKIYEMFSPYIKSKQDIIGQLKIDEMIDENKEVLFKYPNLWYNYELIKEILGNEVYQKNKEKVEKMREKQKIFVWCEQYETALEKLEHEKILVIAGAPGVGKTTLANLICLKYMSKKYEIIENSSENVENIETLVNWEKKTLIFLDDFLGANILEYFKEGERLSNSLVNFIKKIQISNNIKLVVTTRTHILNEANQNSEYFKRLYIDQNKRKKIIELDKYTKIEKAKILYNHLKRGILSEKQILSIKKEKNYNKIIEHPNYTPRIIEYISNEDIEDEIKKEDYITYILDLLKNPIDLWDIPFRKLELKLQKILYIVFSFKKEVEIGLLEEAYVDLVAGSDEEFYFEEKLRILEGTFIKIIKTKKEITVSFLNPSLGDFFLNKLKSNNPILKKIMSKAIRITQIEYLLEIMNFSPLIMELIIKERYIEKFSVEEQTKFLKKCLRKVEKEKLSQTIQKLLFEVLSKGVRTLNTYLDIRGGVFLHGIPLSKESKIKREKNIIEIIIANPSEILIINDIYDLNEVVEILKKFKLLDQYVDMFKDRILELVEEEINNYDYEYEFDKTVNHIGNGEIVVSELYYSDRIYKNGFGDIDEAIFNADEISEKILEEINSIDLNEKYYDYIGNENDDYERSEEKHDYYFNENDIIDSLFEKL